MDKKVPILRTWFNCAIAGGQIVAGSENSGAIFYYPYSTNYIYFDIQIPSSVFAQYGLCGYDATLPAIISTGSGRGDYVNIGSDIKHAKFGVGGKAGCFFIGKIKGEGQIIIKNIYCE